ncbi:hypothetical protein OHA27_36395 [Streptomyces sp. NBC_01619]|nr:hypothetical protein [Streptomyces sp. NBC_01619]
MVSPDRPKVCAALLSALLLDVFGGSEDSPLSGLRGEAQTAGYLCSGELLAGVLGLGQPPGDGNDLLLQAVQVGPLVLLFGPERWPRPYR